MKLLRAFLILITFCVSSAFADEVAPPDAPSTLSGFSVGLESSFFDYHEPGIMRDYGLMTGVAGRWDSAPEPADRKFHVQIEAGALYGQIAYDGATWGGTPVTSPTRDWMANLRALFLRDFKSGRLTISPFGGVGARYLNDRAVGSGSYEREISYLYIMPGATFDWRVSDRIHLGARPEIDDMVWGQVNTHLSDYDPSLPNEVSMENGGLGWRLTTHLNWRFDTFALRFEPYWQHWNVNASNVQWVNDTFGAGQEPANTSDQYGLTVLIQL